MSKGLRIRTPFIPVLVGMAIPATSIVMGYIRCARYSGHRIKWHYKYFDREIEIFSRLATQQQQMDNKFDKVACREVDNPLVLPRVRFVFSSLLTMLSTVGGYLILPLKKLLSGFINLDSGDEPGIYRGQCALCGKDHGFMPIVVIAKTLKTTLNGSTRQKRSKLPSKSASKIADKCRWTS